MVKLVDNERSWAIELIGHINKSLQNKTLQINKAGGETTINNRSDKSEDSRKIMFPDILLYADPSKSKIIQGWELKLPDIPVTDETYIKDAQYKAEILGLNSTLLWNFNQVVLYLKDENQKWTIKKQWNDLNHIKTREDVATYEKDWVNLLEIILIELNDFFVNGKIESNKLELALSDNLLATILEQNKNVVASFLENKATENRLIKIHLDNWWKETKDEYYKDEPTQYLAYSKVIVSNWVIKITFAHMIKRYHVPAKIVEKINYDTEIEQAANIFKDLTKTIDFFTILSPIRFSELIPKGFWKDLTDYNAFLTDQGISELPQEILQSMLEKSIKGIRKEIIGQFTTPPKLAEILVKSTITNLAEDVLEPCVGSGTIAKATLELKKESLSDIKAHESIWASDKFAFPLQIANLTLTDFSTFNIANKVFQSNVFDLKVGKEVKITNPNTGQEENCIVPEFDAIVSNLPFVAFENISQDEKEALTYLGKKIKDSTDIVLSKKSDLYTYIVAHLWGLLKEKGRVGLILSNSWLGTLSGKEFYSLLNKLYHVEYVLISGKKRWFQNAEVITTMLILTKKKLDENPKDTRFGLLKVALDEIGSDMTNELTNHILAEFPISENLIETQKYSVDEINDLLKFNISLNALFHKISWLSNFKDIIIPLTSKFSIIRGMRRGWDPMFYPDANHGIEREYLSRVIKNSKKITMLEAAADNDAFCCSESLENLLVKEHKGAYNWIEKFENGVNKTNKPLVEVLQKSAPKNGYWYEMRDDSTAELVTTLNANKRLFYSKAEKPSFINQRLIGLTRLNPNEDLDLNHALLNSTFGIFFIEATGFGKGLGALDLSKEALSKTFILNADLLSEKGKNNILEAFKPLKKRPILNLEEELAQEDRLNFDTVVLSEFNKEHLYSSVKQSLYSMYKTRLTSLD